jgi:ribonuclease P protein component
MRDMKEPASNLPEEPLAPSASPVSSLESRISHLTSRSHRLRHHADYQRVYKASRKQFAKQMAYFFALRAADAPSDTTGPRIGLTVPKALGKAVDRNRIKRRMRVAIVRALPRLTVSVDVILHPRATVLKLDFSTIEQEVTEVFQKIQARCAPSSSSK